MKIKFNMDFHGEYIRTLKDLRENFSVEDVLEAYDNGLLVKWLDARLYMNELKQVQAITSTNAREILAELIKIFSLETEQKKIDDELTIYDYLQERKKFWQYINENGLQELESVRAKLTQSDNEIAMLKRELDDVKQERDNEIAKLKQELDDVKQERGNRIAKLKWELGDVRRVCDSKIAMSDSKINMLKQELENVKRGRDNLSTKLTQSENEIEKLKQELEYAKRELKKNIKIEIPAGTDLHSWTTICYRDKFYVIKDIGNCKGKLWVSHDFGSGVWSINRANKENKRLLGISVRLVDGNLTEETLYFYIEEV